MREAVESDPYGQLTKLAKDAGDAAPVVIDEAQRVPAMASAIKRIVDIERRPGQFLLTGSSNVFSTLAVADSLAGRLQTCKPWPLIVAESRRRLVAIEVKAPSSVSREDLKHLRRFAEQGPGKGRRVTSILLYLGTEAVVLGERTFALPASALRAGPESANA